MKRIAREIGIPENAIVWDGRLYHAEPSALLAVIRETGCFHEHVMVCGHNPGLTDFCNLVGDSYIDNLPTCGVISIDCSLEKWQDLGAASGSVRFFEYPKKIRSIGGLPGQ